MTQEEKKQFRASKIWKDFVKQFRNKVNNIDYLTNKKAPKYAAVHHCSKEYDNLDEDNFYLLGITSHKAIHHIYRIYRNDEKVIDRLIDILNKMKKLNY